MTPQKIIDYYRLQPHPEGGWYKETYKSNESISKHALPVRFNEDRQFSTAIFFLLEKGNFSAFHKIKSDECWHFYAGGRLLIYIIDEAGKLNTIKLGPNILNDEVCQFVVPANSWFASIPDADTEFSFVGCTVSPGFDFNDLELANGTLLSKEYPQHTNTILALCR